LLACSKSWLYDLLRQHGATLRGLDNWHPDDAQRLKQSLTRESQAKAEPSEKFVADALNKHHYDVKHQVALYFGNIDLVIPSESVAVEILTRGVFGTYMRNGWIKDRIAKCGDRGWHAYFLGAFDTQSIISCGINDLLAWIEFLRRAPTIRRQYRVIWGGCDLLACGCTDNENITIVSPFKYM